MFEKNADGDMITFTTSEEYEQIKDELSGYEDRHMLWIGTPDKDGSRKIVFYSKLTRTIEKIVANELEPDIFAPLRKIVSALTPVVTEQISTEQYDAIHQELCYEEAIVIQLLETERPSAHGGTPESVARWNDDIQPRRGRIEKAWREFLDWRYEVGEAKEKGLPQPSLPSIVTEVVNDRI